MTEGTETTGAPSAHVLHLAGVGLDRSVPPVVHVEEVQEVAVIVSRSCSVEREVRVDRCLDDGVPIVTRPSGGGAVVLAPGMVVASVLAPRLPDDVFPQTVFRRFVSALGSAVETCVEEPTVVRGICDLCIGDCKIAGSSLRVWTDRILFQTCLLVSTDVALLERYLPLPSRMPSYRRCRSHREFVVTLAEAGHAVHVGALVREMSQALFAALRDQGSDLQSTACV